MVATELVISALTKVNKAKAPGLDKISARFVRDAAKKLQCLTLTRLILSMRVLYQKISKILELYHIIKKTDAENYRPVSILCIVYIIIEIIVYNKLDNHYLNLYYEFQSGFQNS